MIKRKHKKTPSPAEEKLLRLVARSIDETGTQPSIRDLAGELGYSVHGYVKNMITSLISKGVVTYRPGRAKSIIFKWRDYL